ncbi:MAG: ribbon-helix-helix protein, CopG family [Ruminococcaceae bacterium]|nr:ribbon-helix-helix protein, CopG family [Oscillospiraceae bacterium]
MDKKSEFIGFRCTIEVSEALKRISADLDRSQSWIINKAIIEYIERREN